jgi:hypothetical protein
MQTAAFSSLFAPYFLRLQSLARARETQKVTTQKAFQSQWLKVSAGTVPNACLRSAARLRSK